VPLVRWTSTTTPTLGHVFEVRVQNGEALYTIVMGGDADQFIPPEHYAAVVTAVQSADAGATPHVRPE
jgi:hypothetical protein